MEKDSICRQQEDDKNDNLVSKNIHFQPVYAALIDQACIDLKLTRRELLEECLKRSLGDPSGIFDD
ncbi:Ribbon-helix-helix protein, copG family [Candidatus Electrothrix aarhusensis]